MLKILILLFLYVKCKIITGPIIGKVTETSARILIETDTDENLTLYIYSTDKFSVNKGFNAKHPNIISLNNLIPETKYYLFRQWTGRPSIDMISIGSFRTLSGNLDKPFNVVVVACNDYKYINTGSHWYNIVRQVKRVKLIIYFI